MEIKQQVREEAKDTLRKQGYYVDNLWHVEDVKSMFECSDDAAQRVLDKVMQNESVMFAIWDAIDYAGEQEGLSALDDE